MPALLSDALGRVPASAVQHYPRRDELRSRVARHHGVPPDEIVLCAGSDAAIQTIAAILGPASPEGRQLILQVPNYEPWETYARMHGLRVTPVSLAGGPEPFIERLAAVLAGAPPSLVAISNPNGPVGSALSIEELRLAAGVCGARGHLFVIDQCYGAFAGLDHVAPFEDLEHVVVVNSFSKAFGLAGARIASVIARGGAMRRLRASGIERTVSGPSSLLLDHMLGCTETLQAIWADIARSRAWFADRVCEARPEWRALPSAANFVSFAGPHPEAALDLVRWMGRHDIRIRALDDAAGFETCVRFTVADLRTMEAVLDVLVAAPR